MAALGLSFVVFGLCQESCVEKRLQRDHNPPQEIMRRLVEAVAPARVGTGFRWPRLIGCARDLDGTALWIRLSDLDMGFYGYRRPSAGRARELPRPSWQRVHGRTVRRPRSRRNDRCSRRWYLGSAGAVLVRVRWFGTQPGDCLAATTQGRSRRCADRGRI